MEEVKTEKQDKKTVGRAGTDERIVKQLQILAENNKKWSAGKILIQLRSWAKQNDLDELVPTERTVARLRKEWDDKKEEERVPLRFFSWPESMGTSDLPWEAARTCFELVTWLEKCKRKFHDENATPPTVDEARWFWRVSLLATEAPIAIRFLMATIMSMRRGRAYPAGLSALAYRPWASRKLYAAYMKDIASGSIKPMLELEPDEKRLFDDFWTNEKLQYCFVSGMRFGAEIFKKFPDQEDEIMEYLDEEIAVASTIGRKKK